MNAVLSRSPGTRHSSARTPAPARPPWFAGAAGRVRKRQAPPAGWRRRQRCHRGGERALLIAAKEGREDLMELLAGFKADLNVRYDGWTVLHTMTHGKGNPAVVQALVKAGAMLGRLSAGRPP